jgi:lactoylglutathione lyase
MTVNLAFDHIHVFCTDVAKTEAWFVDVLGATSDGLTPTGMTRLRLGGTVILLRAERPGEGLAPTAPSRHFGTDHIGFRVPDVSAAYAELQAKGVVFEHPPREAVPGVTITFLRGPDDVRIELLQLG